MAKTWTRTCPLCEATCGLLITTEGDEITDLRGDADDVFSSGFICPKGAALGHLHADPDRLRAPLVRRDGEHVEVSWAEAFEAVAEGLSSVAASSGGDRNAVGVYLGNPNVHNLAGAIYMRPLLKALGTRNIFSASTVDQMPRHVSSGMLFGHPDRIPVPDIDRTDLLLMLGANPWDSNGSLCTAPDFPGRLRALRARGGKLIVVDPRRTRTARHADEHLFIRPGTDAHLLVAILHALLRDPGGADPGEHLSKHTEGLDVLRQAVAPFSPEAVAPLCGIDASRIRALAGALAEAERAVVYGRIGTHTAPFGTVASWAADAINIVTGNLDRPGGALFPLAAHSVVKDRSGGRGFATGRWVSRVRGLPEVRGELPVSALSEEIETEGPGQIKALITIAGNPLRSTPNSARLEAAIRDNLDFMVSVDIYLNESTRMADVILPPPSSLSRGHYDLAFYGLSIRNIANYSTPIFPPEGPTESEILARLTLIAGGQGPEADPALVDGFILSFLAQKACTTEGSPVQGRSMQEILSELPPGPGPERALDLMLRTGPYGEAFGANPGGLSLDKLKANPHGIDLGPLKPRLPEVLETPSGRIELVPEPILTDLVRLEAAMGEATGGLLLVGRRHLRSNNSWMHNLTPLASGKKRCTLQLHPDDAARLGLGEGDSACVTSRVGSVIAPVEVTDGIMPGVVSLPHGWGHGAPGARLRVAAEHAGVNSNILTDEAHLDPLSGNAVLNAIPVQVAFVG